MKRSKVAIGMLATAMTIVPLAVSRAEAPAPNASVSASASASAAPRKPRFADDLPSPDKTPVPTAAEWKAATAIRLDRSLPASCSASRVREWVRVTCSGVGASAGLVAGVAEGYSAMVGVPSPGAPDESTSYWAQFPVRRGERRLMYLRHAGRGNYDETLYATDAVYVSVQWNEGEAPMLLAQDGR
jgi:hypothetical protein